MVEEITWVTVSPSDWDSDNRLFIYFKDLDIVTFARQCPNV